MMGVLTKRGNLKTDMYAGKSPCEDEERDRERLPLSKERQGSKPQKLGERHGKDFSSEGINPADTLTLDFYPPEH